MPNDFFLMRMAEWDKSFSIGEVEGSAWTGLVYCC